MRRTWIKNAAACVVMGVIAAAVTFNIERISAHSSNLIERWLQTIAFTLVVPGLLADFLAGRSGHNLSLWMVASCNFLFWLAFAGLFSFLLNILRQQIRLLASRL